MSPITDPIAVGAFYILAASAVLSAAMVTTLRNITHGALFLLMTFASVAGLYFILGADFVAAVQILIYAGAVMVVLLFAIMLTRGAMTIESNQPNTQILFGGAVTIFLFAILAFVLTNAHWAGAAAGVTVPTTAGIGWLLFRVYMLPFEISTLILIAAMIGAIVLARED